MKRLILTAALAAACLLPRTADAQVEKQVEVTKEYVPQLQQAAKLPVEPDMTDTTRMRPEIAYTVTPLSLSSALAMQPIQPATVTYWDFNRPLPFYVKAGAGYPLNSVFDLYAATQHPNTGYLVGYINHDGRFADIANSFGLKHNSTQMQNRIGAAAGTYVGRHTLEGSIAYENRLRHRYGAWAADASAADLLPAAPGARVDFGEADFAIRFGDDFHDLSRLNFDIAFGGNLFYDHTDWQAGTDDARRQLTLQAAAKLAKAFGKHRIGIEAGYERLAGRRALDAMKEDRVHAALRYGAAGRVIDFEAGVDYYYDQLAGSRGRHYVLPFLRLDFNFGTSAMHPFFELDGALQENSYRTLTRECPYVVPGSWGPRNTRINNGRLGIRGDLWRDRFTYRLYAALSIRDYRNYWYAVGFYDPATEAAAALTGAFAFEQGRQTLMSLHGEVEFRPASALVLDLGFRGYIFHDDPDLRNGMPAFEARFGARYTVKRLTLGLSLTARSARDWSTIYYDLHSGATAVPEEPGATVFTDAATADLRFTVDWKLSGRFALFAEGDNLLNRRQHLFAWYPDYGARFTAGIKFAF